MFSLTWDTLVFHINVTKCMQPMISVLKRMINNNHQWWQLLTLVSQGLNHCLVKEWY